MTSNISPSTSCAFPSPVILPRVMLSWAVAREKMVLEVLSPKRCTPGLQRIKISADTFELCLGFQGTTWWGMSKLAWMMRSSWWKKISHYLLQNKTKDFSGIYKVEEDTKMKNENYYWKLFSFFGNDLLNNLCTSPRLPSQPCCRIKRQTSKGSVGALEDQVKMLLILWFFCLKKKVFCWWQQ